MLYITTRNNNDAYTAHRALHENVAPDGGVFVPFRMPSFATCEFRQLMQRNFGEIIAELLNRFFACKLSGWDVDFCIGRNAVKLATMPHRNVVAEMWHNPQGLYGHLIDNLYGKISGTANAPTEWFRLAVNISVLFGIYGEMCRNEIITCGDSIDFTAKADDLILPVAAMYAREMGLPIGTVIFTCEESSGLWDLIHHGELSYSVQTSTDINYERLIHAMLGVDGVNKFEESVDAKKNFRVDEEKLSAFNKGLFCTVAGESRCPQTINSIYRSNAYLLDPIAAQCIGGLQDYRAKTGESKLTLLISGTSPINCVSQITEATGISAERLRSLLEEPRNRSV